MTDRCDLTDLLVDQCACKNHKGGRSPEEEAAAERARVRARLLGNDGDPRWFAAVFPGTCGRCGDRFDAGTAIRMRDDLFSETASDSNWIADCCARPASRVSAPEET